MKTWNTTLTAAEAVSMGMCAGSCLVATKDTCDCVCAGAHHGVLASAAIAEVTHTVRVGARTVRRHKPAVRSNVPARRGTDAGELLLDMRADGRTIGEIAAAMVDAEIKSVTPGMVRKRLREYEESGAGGAA